MITPINGRKGRMQINSINLNIDDCNVAFSTNEVIVTGFEDQQGDGRTPTGRTDGVDDFSGTLSGYVNADALPATLIVDAAARCIVQGAIALQVKLFLDKSIIQNYCGCTRCIVYRVNYMTKVNDGWKYSIEVKCAGGTIKHPTT